MKNLPDLPTLNLSLLTKGIEWAELSEKYLRRDPDLLPEDEHLVESWGVWDQGTYATNANPVVAMRNGEVAPFCGSAYCQAGQAVVQAGYTMKFGGAEVHTATCVDPHGERHLISDVAQELLGLTGDEASAYFEGDNDLGMLRYLANTFAHRRGLPLPYPTEEYDEDWT